MTAHVAIGALVFQGGEEPSGPDCSLLHLALKQGIFAAIDIEGQGANIAGTCALQHKGHFLGRIPMDEQFDPGYRRLRCLTPVSPRTATLDAAGVISPPKA